MSETLHSSTLAYIDRITSEIDGRSPLERFRDKNHMSVWIWAEKLEDLIGLDPSDGARLILQCERGQIDPREHIALGVLCDLVIGDDAPGLHEAQAAWFSRKRQGGGR